MAIFYQKNLHLQDFFLWLSKCHIKIGSLARKDLFIITEAYVFLVILLSSFLQTTTGFGYAIITAPLLALVLSAKETVMLVMLTALIICVFLLRATRNQGSFKAIAPLLAASVIGAIPGAFVMTRMSNEGLKLFIGVLLLFVTVALWKRYTFPVKPSK